MRAGPLVFALGYGIQLFIDPGQGFWPKMYREAWKRGLKTPVRARESASQRFVLLAWSIPFLPRTIPPIRGFADPLAELRRRLSGFSPSTSEGLWRMNQ
jgi:hypothetical protein